MNMVLPHAVNALASLANESEDPARTAYQLRTSIEVRNVLISV
jgi:hypothetical protein